jgi:hypothetical protein
LVFATRGSFVLGWDILELDLLSLEFYRCISNKIQVVRHSATRGVKSGSVSAFFRSFLTDTAQPEKEISLAAPDAPDLVSAAQKG